MSTRGKTLRRKRVATSTCQQMERPYISNKNKRIRNLVVILRISQSHFPMVFLRSKITVDITWQWQNAHVKYHGWCCSMKRDRRANRDRTGPSASCTTSEETASFSIFRARTAPRTVLYLSAEQLALAKLMFLMTKDELESEWMLLGILIFLPLTCRQKKSARNQPNGTRRSTLLYSWQPNEWWTVRASQPHDDRSSESHHSQGWYVLPYCSWQPGFTKWLPFRL